MTIKTTQEQFDELMALVPTEPFRAPASMQESRMTRIKPTPMLEAKMDLKKKSDKKAEDKVKAKKTLSESAEKIIDLYSQFVLEGVSTKIMSDAPETREAVTELESILCEAVSKAKDLL